MRISLTVIWNPEKANSTEALRTSAHSMALSTELRSSTLLQKEKKQKVTKLTMQCIQLRVCPILFFSHNHSLEKSKKVT